MHFHLARAKGQLLVLLAVLLGLTVVDAAVSAKAGWDTFGGIEQSQTFSRLEQASAKVLALDSAATGGTHVGLVVGMSTADWGIDLSALPAGREHLRWAKLTGEFASFTNLLDVVERMQSAHARPSQTLLCVHYGMLLGARRHKSTRAERILQLRERTGQARSFSELARVVTLSWLGNNRAGAANELELVLGRLRANILGSFGQPSAIVFPQIGNPFQDSVNKHTPMHPSVRERHVAQAQERWRIAQSPRALGDEAAQAAALTEIVRLLSQGSKLTIVLMPEHSALRAVEPEPFARSLLEDALTKARSEAPRILDLRAALPDPYFADEVHATAIGRPVLTRALSHALGPAFGDP